MLIYWQNHTSTHLSHLEIEHFAESDARQAGQKVSYETIFMRYTHGDLSALSLRLFGEDLTQTGPDIAKRDAPEAEADDVKVD